MSSETKTYSSALGAINKRVVESRPVTEEEEWRDWPAEVDFVRGAEAVAAKVLRDLKSALGGFTGGYEHGEDIDVGSEIDAFALDCGIDQGEKA